MSGPGGPDDDDSRGMPSVPDSVQEAVRTLIRWAGDDPAREGLRDTPQRVARAWKEYCAGYSEDPARHLARMFEEVGGYDEIVLKTSSSSATREPHGADHATRDRLLPTDRVVGISKLARVLTALSALQYRASPESPSALGRGSRREWRW